MGYQDFLTKIFGEGQSFLSSLKTPSGAPTGDTSLPSQLIYPQDLFSADSAPFILFFAVDPVKVNSDPLEKIALYMPKDLEVHYGINYSEATNYIEYAKAAFSGEAGAASVLGNPLSAGAGAWAGARALGTGGGIGGATIAAIQGALASVDNSTAIGQQLALNRKKTLNPHMAALFQGVNFRRHQFAFDLIARNKEESETINQIIYKFKLHAHPEAGDPDSQTTFMEWPSSWQIGLFSPARKYLYNISTCQLTNFIVNYAGGGHRAFFSDTGAPVSVKIAMEFMETEQMTRGRIRQGF